MEEIIIVRTLSKLKGVLLEMKVFTQICGENTNQSHHIRIFTKYAQVEV